MRRGEDVANGARFYRFKWGIEGTVKDDNLDVLYATQSQCCAMKQAATRSDLCM
eukprot:m.349616 g.349616  ORF g.349616 m.349616 type:complete len:54 (-) comp16575_c0_seq8:35-196(-)